MSCGGEAFSYSDPRNSLSSSIFFSFGGYEEEEKEEKEEEEEEDEKSVLDLLPLD